MRGFLLVINIFNHRAMKVSHSIHFALNKHCMIEKDMVMILNIDQSAISNETKYQMLNYLIVINLLYHIYQVLSNN